MEKSKSDLNHKNDSSHTKNYKDYDAYDTLDLNHKAYIIGITAVWVCTYLP